MTKKTRRVSQTEPAPAGVTAVSAAEERLEGFAEDLGKLLGQAQNKAESWLGQRKAIADHLVGVRDTATRLLAQLGIVEAPRRGRKPGTGGRRQSAAEGSTATRAASRRGRPIKKKRIMSPEAREKIAAAQRARWAKQRKNKD
jgi:hypothetical protein